MNYEELCSIDECLEQLAEILSEAGLAKLRRGDKEETPQGRYKRGAARVRAAKRYGGNVKAATGHSDPMRQAAKEAGMRTRTKSPARGRRKFAGFKTSTTVPAKQQRAKKRSGLARRRASAEAGMNPISLQHAKISGKRITPRRKKHSSLG